MTTTKENTPQERLAHELIIKDKLFETFFIQRDIDMVYSYLNQITQCSVFALADQDKNIDPFAVEFINDLKETIMTIGIMTGDIDRLGNFKHQEIIKRFLENSKAMKKEMDHNA